MPVFNLFYIYDTLQTSFQNLSFYCLLLASVASSTLYQEKNRSWAIVYGKSQLRHATFPSSNPNFSTSCNIWNVGFNPCVRKMWSLSRSWYPEIEFFGPICVDPVLSSIRRFPVQSNIILVLHFHRHFSYIAQCRIYRQLSRILRFQFKTFQRINRNRQISYDLLYIISSDDQKYIITRVHPFN